MNIDNITSEAMTLDYDGKMTQIKVYEQEIERLTKENKILRENAEHNDKVVDKVNWENEKLHSIIREVREYVKQLIDLKEEDYLKSVSLIYIEKILEILDKANEKENK